MCYFFLLSNLKLTCLKIKVLIEGGGVRTGVRSERRFGEEDEHSELEQLAGDRRKLHERTRLQGESPVVARQPVVRGFWCLCEKIHFEKKTIEFHVLIKVSICLNLCVTFFSSSLVLTPFV